jgi:Ca2+-transporting ATPase
MLGLFSESTVLTGGALAAFGYGLMRYGPGARAGTLAYESLSAAKVLHALTCRPWAPNSPSATQRPANPLLNAALVTALVAQAGTILVPGLRRLLNIAPLNLADLAVIGLTALTTRSINRNIREKRRIESKHNSNFIKK